VDERRPVLSANHTARYRYHGDGVSRLGDRSARLHRDRFSVGNFSGTVCFCRLQRESSSEGQHMLQSHQ
ncbi:hypothetical protein ILYODFUR_022568, partial [Ilyodon furcidens]